jgi:Flp pilus assembly pilin Flp
MAMDRLTDIIRRLMARSGDSLIAVEYAVLLTLIALVFLTAIQQSH